MPPYGLPTGTFIQNMMDGHFEIVAITRTISIHGSHLHSSVSDGAGQTVGGHLVAG
jgi:predicted DNA-binding protein with PD1-like motif